MQQFRGREENSLTDILKINEITDLHVENSKL